MNKVLPIRRHWEPLPTGTKRQIIQCDESWTEMKHEGMTNGSIRSLLQNGEWIDLDSITFGDGRIILLEVDFLADREYQIQPIADTTIDSCIKYAQGSYASIDAYGHAESNHYEAFVGAGSLEDDGFILITERVTGDIKWLTFFRSSSPFRKILSLDEQQITVLSEDEMVWVIPIEEPDKIVISKRQE